MKILQVLVDNYGEVGGVSVHVRNISERLAKHHDVTVFATNDKGLKPWQETVNGVKVERFRCFAPGNAYFFTVDLPLRLRKENFEIVHAHGYHAFPFHLATLAKGDRFVATPHFHGVGHSPFRNALVRLLKPFGKRTLSKADVVVAVSDFEKSLICREFGFDEGRVKVIPNGVDFSEFAGLRKQRHDNRSILSVGYLAAFKGAQYLVEVLPRLPRDVVLHIVGRGPMKPLMQKRASELGISDRVKFYDNVSRKDLLQMYADTDVFASLSRYEAYSIVVAEALAAGTPCVIARTSALTEWDDGETCLGVEFPINLKELAEKITSILDSNRETRAFDKWFGNKILDWDQVAEKLERIYVK